MTMEIKYSVSRLSYSSSRYCTLFLYAFFLLLHRLTHFPSLIGELCVTSAASEVRVHTAEVKGPFLIDTNLVFQSWGITKTKIAHTCFYAGERWHTSPFKPIQLSTVWVSPFLGFLRYFIGNWEWLCEVCLSQIFCLFVMLPELAAFQGERHSRLGELRGSGAMAYSSDLKVSY